ncbi:MAG: hydroxymethylbilane synthase [Acidimicrobiales bacterium]
MRVRLATRRSPLAQWQANHVAAALRAVEPGLDVELVAVDTAPDRDLTRSIAEFGGKGAFSTGIQRLVLDGVADIAVHSAKDLQAVTPAGLVLAAFTERGTVVDCLVGARLDDLSPGATVATGSGRRRALLLDDRPDLKVDDLRGNIGTRLARLADVDAIVMAAVALERLDERPAVVDLLDPVRFVPQVGQGALAVECRPDDGDLAALLAAIDHAPTRLAVEAERSFLRDLGGDCDLPAGAHATVGADGRLTVRGILADTDADTDTDTDADADTNPAPGDRSSARLRRATVVDTPAADPGRQLAVRLRQPHGDGA